MTRPLTTSLLLVALGCAPAAAGDTLTGKVVAVADGDTITVLQDKTPVKIRLHGVDAPEKAQPFGERAKQFTSSLVFGKEVRVEVAARDRYGRTVGRVYVMSPPACLEAELVKAGLAWWYRQYSPKDKKLAQLEEQARKAKRGLWAEANPTPPWEWRRSRRGGVPAPPTRSTLGPYRGNTRSKALHAPGCRDYGCRSCTAGFGTIDEASRAGYRPHQACVAPFEKCYGGCLMRPRAKAATPQLIEAECQRSCAPGAGTGR